ncbi:MAG TPA: hypothetical protein VMQ44_01210, partial [Candidatus Saccharimonadales bacterium]|nr:hypothetical protein [Candidatus Saccharimonadales bacterium]
REAINCEACGRVHFLDENLNDFEEGEYKEYKDGAEKDPDKYIGHDSDGPSIGYMHFNDKQVVFDCPCNYTRQLENLLWHHAGDVAEYFVARTKAEKKEADRMARSAARAGKAISNR